MQNVQSFSFPSIADLDSTYDSLKNKTYDFFSNKNDTSSNSTKNDDEVCYPPLGMNLEMLLHLIWI